MTLHNGSDTTPIHKAALAGFAAELWRLDEWLKEHRADPANAPAVHALRKLKSLLNECGIAVVDLSGRSYDAGLAVTVVACDHHGNPGHDRCIVAEMISPIVTLNGDVIKRGEVVTSHAPENSRSNARQIKEE